MKVMLCIPTFISDLDAELNTEADITCRQLHLAGFKVLVKMLEMNDDHSVYCALRTYNWHPSEFAKPKDAVKRDWEEIQNSDHVIACPVVNSRASKGVHVEIGWASAIRKPLSILIHRPRTRQSVVITGLRHQRDFDVTYFYYQNDPADVFSDLREHLYSYES